MDPVHRRNGSGDNRNADPVWRTSGREQRAEL
jgi:hypothetical protein